MPPSDSYPAHAAVEGSPLLERLLSRASAFDFRQAVLLLELAGKDTVPLGHRGPVSREALRFRPDVSLGFPSADVCQVRSLKTSDDDESCWQMDVTFMGLYGTSTPLPLHYATEILRATLEASRQEAPPAGSPDLAARAPSSSVLSDTPPQRAFLDVLHHRLISLFYRAATKYRSGLYFGCRGTDALASYLIQLIGCSPQWTAAELGIPPLRLMAYAGGFAQNPRCTTNLEQILSDYWEGLPVQIDQYVGRWVALPADNLCEMGSACSTLGKDVIAGDQVYDRSGSFTISLGPVDWRTYLVFLPESEGQRETRSLVQLYCTSPFGWGLEVIIAANQIPETRLSSDDDAGRLGWTSWVRTGEMGETRVLFWTVSESLGGEKAPARDKGDIEGK